ncbi:MAG: acyltransferase family protein [Solirubrobacteraceae bacterium]
MQTATVTAQVIPPATVTEPVSSPAAPRRVEWLDGIRGAAALFVVLHHTWLSVWPAFPRNIGPWWVGWLLYGHLAVAVFIVVSGFSLSLAPIRRGDTLSGGAGRFLRRRAWRIIPPYWAALIISTLISWLVLQPSLAAGTVTRGFVVHGLLLQDITGSWVPNGAFWSIAVEWQIYFMFPLILWLARRTNMRMSVFSTVALVLAVKWMTTLGTPFDKISHLTPQFLALFAVGVLAAQVGHKELDPKVRRLLASSGLATLAAIVIAAVVEGSVWMVNRYFWVDIAFGCAVACVMAVMYAGGAARSRRLLASRPMLRLGLFSYSIYLLHGPFVGVMDLDIIRPLHLAPLVGFALLLTVGVPLILVVCYGFHLVFEAPFLHRRDAGALREIPIFGKLFRPRGRVASPSTGRPASPSTARAADVVAVRESTT